MLKMMKTGIPWVPVFYVYEVNFCAFGVASRVIT